MKYLYPTNTIPEWFEYSRGRDGCTISGRDDTNTTSQIGCKYMSCNDCIFSRENLDSFDINNDTVEIYTEED